MNEDRIKEETSKKLKTASKFLSLLLRHQPETIGIELDLQGWANIDELIERSATKCPLNRPLIEEVVRTNDKQRFALSECKNFIRANQGHSIAVELALEPQTPPQTLFHGTATRFVESIQQQGLDKRQRQHVHLSDNRETATKVGSRHGKPIILSVRAADMHTAGLVFYRSANGVWLTNHVPAEYIKFTA